VLLDIFLVDRRLGPLSRVAQKTNEEHTQRGMKKGWNDFVNKLYFMVHEVDETTSEARFLLLAETSDIVPHGLLKDRHATC